MKATRKPKGKLMIIGGGEKSEGGAPIFERLVQETQKTKGPLVLINVASYEPIGEAEQRYKDIFAQFNLKQIEVVDIRAREDAKDEENVRKCAGASVLYFTGGDQLRLTSQVADSPTYRCMCERYLDGALIAGTSAGAAAMSDTMLVGGPSDTSNRISALSMAPGLGLLDDVVIDTHFAERGRMGRLLGAVAQNPKNLGLGIDEATAILVEKGETFTVIGEGAVYVVDGSAITGTSLSIQKAEGVVSIYNVRLHVLSTEDKFDLMARRPVLKE